MGSKARNACIAALAMATLGNACRRANPAFVPPVVDGDAGSDGVAGDPRAESAGDAASVTGLIGWWKLDETGGTTAEDSSGHGLTGVLVGSPLRVTGRIGGAVALDGTSQYVLVDYAPVLNTLSREMTIALWVKKAVSNIKDGLWTILAQRRSGNANEVWGLGYRDTALDEPQFWVWLQPSGQVSSPTGTASNMDVNIWRHYAGVFDGSEARFYQDGVLMSSTAASGTLQQDQNSPLTIGAGENGSGINEYAPVTVDDVRLYSRALSAEEIAGLAAGRP